MKRVVLIYGLLLCLALSVNGIGKGVEIDNWAARLCAWVYVHSFLFYG